jgi:digeranylgeranylglycerophospholipid reductase
LLDVVVIGGGPVGSRLAYRLAALGYQVYVFEKRSEIGGKPCCTGIVSQECISTFDIPTEVILGQVNSAKVFSPSGESIRFCRPETKAAIINRPAFDRAMARKAQMQGVKYKLSSTVLDITVQTHGVLIRGEEKGTNQEYEARAAVLATGFNAPLVKGLGFGQVGYFTAGAQAELQVRGVNEVEVYFDQKLARGFFAWLVPTQDGRCFAGLMSRNSCGYYLREWLKKLERQGKIMPQKHQIAYGGIPLKPLSRTFGDRLLVVGDAAGQVKSTTGGGIYFGMLCADIAAETLHDALRVGDFSAGRLSRYEQDWRKTLGRELSREYYARRLFQRLSDHQIDIIFSWIKSTDMVEFLLKENISFDWHGGLMLHLLKIGVMAQAKSLLNNPLTKGKKLFEV